MDQREREYELQRLEIVLQQIRMKLREGNEQYRGARGELQEALAEYWDNSKMDYWGLSQLTTAINRQRSLTMASYVRRRQFQKMQSSPYFGRIDFQERSEEVFLDPEAVYIGIGTLTETNTGKYLVYDWRSPIAGMFYDYEKGPAGYDCPAGRISGEIMLKRQYKISDGRMEYMFDADLKIDDEMLQEILGKSTDDKMRTIVTTIQREQNRAIRDERHHILLVQGTAGSGKTSIALHRAAYLLYRDRESITSRNILVLSPNQIFSDYISNVLPELGEENVLQTTFQDYVTNNKARIPGKVEDWNTQIEYLLKGCGDQAYATRMAGIHYKLTGFITVIENYIGFLENDLIRNYGDIRFQGRMVFPQEDWETLFFENLRYLPVLERLKQIRQRIQVNLRPLIHELRQEKEKVIAATGEEVNEKTIKALARLATRQELDGLLADVDQMTLLDPFLLYRRLFENRDLWERLAQGTKVPREWAAICKQTLSRFNDGIIPYEDSLALLYLQGSLAGFPVRNDIRHVIIDEAQDYTPFQFKILGRLFPRCSWTILRDPDQTVLLHIPVAGTDEVINSLEQPLSKADAGDTCDDKTGPNSLVIQLTRSYRSTREIQVFCRALLLDPAPVASIRRSGIRPQLIPVKHSGSIADDDYTAAITLGIEELVHEGWRSIGVICKTASEAAVAYKAFKNRVAINLITWEMGEFERGTIVVPAYLAKGLEFDAVLVYDASARIYHREVERSLLYIACTRALHRLKLYYRHELSPFVAKIDEALYTISISS